MNVVGKVRSLISQGVYSVATPFHPFGGAVDIIIVEQPDGTYRSTPWYVRFGKFQGVLRGSETVVDISVNDVEAGFHMYLDNSGEAYFLREVMSGKDNADDQDLENIGILEASQDGNDSSDINCQTENELSIADDIEISNVCDENVKINSEHDVFEFHDERISHVSPVGSPGYGAYHCGSFKDVGELAESQGGSDSEVVLVSVDGHVLTAPFSSSDKNNDNVQLSMPQFHLGPAEVADVAIEQLQDSAESSGNNGDLRTSKDAWTTGLFGDVDALTPSSVSEGIFPICGDDNTPSYPSDGCRDVRKFTYQAQEALNIKNVRDNLGMNIDTGIGEKEIFTSCLELSELISGSERDNSQGIDSPSMGLAATGGTCDPQEETETGDEHKLENGAGLTLPNSDSLCSNESPTVITQIESPENSALITEKTDSVISEGVTTPPSTNGSERKSEQLGVPSEMQRLESGQGMPAFEDCNKPGIWDSHSGESSDKRSNVGMGIEISLCRNLLRAGMGLDSAKEAFNSHQITEEEFKVAGVSIVKNENLIVRFKEKYFTWDKAAPIMLGIAAFGLDFPVELKDDLPVEKETPKLIVDSSQLSSSPGSSWRLWPIPFRRIKTLQHSNSNSSSEEVYVDSEPYVSPRTGLMQGRNGDIQSPQKQFVRTNIPTSEQIASLNLKDGQNMVAFSCYTRVLRKQKVDAHIYLWKWNARIVISDVDGTITRSDVLGQFMPLVGRDWTQSGVAQLFSAIKENGYQLLFLSARAIVQAYLTRSFLLNLKQDGKALPSGPVVISPDGLLPSLYREVIRRAPHEFKIACLQDIRALFPSDYNPFYAGFGNRDTDELSYRKIGIPKGKIFIINPKGEVAVNHSIDVKSYTSLHTLVHDMFPPTSLAEQEDFNSWNYWKMPLPDIDC